MAFLQTFMARRKLRNNITTIDENRKELNLDFAPNISKGDTSYQENGTGVPIGYFTRKQFEIKVTKQEDTQTVEVDQRFFVRRRFKMESVRDNVGNNEILLINQTAKTYLCSII